MFKYINEYDSSNAKEEMLNIYINSKNPNENTLKIKNNNSNVWICSNNEFKKTFNK